MFLKTFGWSLAITVLALATALVYGSWSAVVITLILGVLEISLSFDNAVVNARILERMSPFWQKMFLTVGIVIAVFGMRVLFPLLIVAVTAQLNPVEAVRLALEKGSIEEPGTYAYLLHEAHPQIAAFGGMFLLMIFLDFMFEERDILWLKWLERPLLFIGKLPMVNVVVALALLALFGATSGDHKSTVLIAGIAGLITYFLVTGLGGLFDVDDPEDDGNSFENTGEMVAEADRIGKKRRLGHVAGRAAFLLFLYLEVIDASFSFDGVIGAFAITADPIIIALGLGLIGAMFVRSLTVFLVRQGTLDEFEYLDHGAHWAIGALAVILLVTITTEVNEIVTGLIGVVFILAAFISSVARNRRKAHADARPEPSVLSR